MADSFLGGGDLYIDRLTSAGAVQGYKVAGNATKFALIPESEIKEQTGRGRTNYGQVIASATLPGKTSIKMTLNQLDADNLAIAFLGSVTAGSQTSGSVTAVDPDELTVIVDRWLEIGKEDLSEVVVKGTDMTGDGGTDKSATTYTAGTHYLLNPRLGLIKVLDVTGAPDAGEVIALTYSYGGVTYQTITGADSPIIRCRLMLDGQNYVNGRNCKVLVKNARLKPSTEVDFLSEDFLPLELEGLCEIPEGDTTPFEITYYDVEE